MDRVVAVYAGVAAVWILVSGPIAAWVADTWALPLLGLELVKGLVFVLATSLVLRAALRGWARRIERAARVEREAAAALRVANATRTDFLTSISHELRTPLTSIIGFARTLSDHAETVAPGQRRQLADRLVANAQRLDALVRDLLDVTALTEGVGELHRREADLADLAQRVAEIRVAPDHPIQVRGTSVRAHVDVAKVERILIHLLDNVRRHTPPGTCTTLSVEARDHQVVLAVSDDGPGLPAGPFEELAAPFAQGPGAANSHHPGVGIGLTIVDRYARLHGGHVRARPAEVGTYIEVVLPAGPITPASPTTPADERGRTAAS